METLISIAFLGTAVTALLLAMTASSHLSGGHRRDATADSVVRSFAEAVKDVDYRNSPSNSHYTTAANSKGFQSRSGYSAAVTSIRCAVAAGTDRTVSVTAFQPCGGAGTDPGLQRVDVTVTYTGGDEGTKTQVLTLLKRRVS